LSSRLAYSVSQAPQLDFWGKIEHPKAENLWLDPVETMLLSDVFINFLSMFSTIWRQFGGKSSSGLGGSLRTGYNPLDAPTSKGAFGMRSAKISRKTAETDISVEINLDGTGRYDNKTGVGFFDHMLDQLSRHALIDMTLRAKGDLHIDDHHTVEDCGIALGQALAEAMGDKRGIRRYGECHLAMDDAQVRCALDLSGRPYLICNLDLQTAKIGTFDTELVREFFQAFSTHGGITLHIDRLHGFNSHHIVEAAFKAVARALRDALEVDPRKAEDIPSTKGSL
jgi:imidazoleglycerol-phosphate dehydratase